MTRTARLAWATLAWNIAVILWGAYVRATGSGAGCGEHWPLCNGVVIPRSPSDATLIEFTHRATSGLALLAVFALAAAVFRSLPRGHRARTAAGASVILILTEAAVGAGLVLLRLVAEDESIARAIFMAVHLVNTFLLLAALSTTALFATRDGTGTGAPAPVRGVLSATLGALVLVGVSGAIAALGDTLYPSRSVAEGFAADLSPTASALIRLRVLHPVLALGGALLAVLAAWRTAIHLRDGLAFRLSLAAGSLAALQLLAGAANLLLLAPVWLQLVHLLLADGLWISLVLLRAHAQGGSPAEATA